MSKVGNYCKAYLRSQLNAYPDWNENENEKAALSAELAADDPVLFLHENFYVTRGIYQDVDVVFDSVNTAWMDFCRNVLHFAVPAELTSQSNR